MLLMLQLQKEAWRGRIVGNIDTSFYGFFTVDFVAHHDTGPDFLDRPCALLCSWPWKNVLPKDGMQLLPAN